MVKRSGGPWEWEAILWLMEVVNSLTPPEGYPSFSYFYSPFSSYLNDNLTRSFTSWFSTGIRFLYLPIFIVITVERL